MLADFLILFYLSVSFGVPASLLRSKLGFSKVNAFLAASLLVPAQIVGIQILLSPFNLMGSNSAFLTASVVFLLGEVWFLKRFQSPAGEPIQVNHVTKWELWEKITLGLFFGLWLAILSFSFLSDLKVPDTLVMKLPNAFFYLQKGNLFPASEASTFGRLFGTPFNGTLLWAFVVRFHADNRWIIGFNFLAWSFSLLGIYQFCRDLKSSFKSSLWAALLAGFSLAAVFQANGDNDDLLSSAPVIICVSFFIRWIRRGKVSDGLFAGLGLGLGFGAKAFPALYWPAFFVVGAIYCVNWGRARSLEWIRQRFISGSALLLSFSFFALPYAVVRWLTVGKFGFSGMVDPLLNKPFRFDIFYHNLVAYSSQLFAGPFGDLLSFSSGKSREALMNHVNPFFWTNIIPKVTNVAAYGEVPNVIEKYIYEATALHGFLPWALLIFGIYAFKKLPEKRREVLMLGFFFVVWHLYIVSRIKFMGGVMRYWILPLWLVAPVIALAWDELRTASKNWKSKTLIFFFFFVAGTTLYFGFTGIYKDFLRYNLKDIWSGSVAKDRKAKNKAIPQFINLDSEINQIMGPYGFTIYDFQKHFYGKRYTLKGSIERDQMNFYPLWDGPIINPITDEIGAAILIPGETQKGFQRIPRIGIMLNLFLLPGPRTMPCNICVRGERYIIARMHPGYDQVPETHQFSLSFMGGGLEDKFQYELQALDINKNVIMSLKLGLQQQVEIPGDSRQIKFIVKDTKQKIITTHLSLVQELKNEN